MNNILVKKETNTKMSISTQNIKKRKVNNVTDENAITEPVFMPCSLCTQKNQH